MEIAGSGSLSRCPRPHSGWQLVWHFDHPANRGGFVLLAPEGDGLGLEEDQELSSRLRRRDRETKT